MAGVSLSTRGRFLGRAGTADAALAILVVSVVALMVVPLPTWLLDVLLAANLAGSIAVLLVALYVGSALEISSFPTLLLITTLARIALNVSSTRLILLQGDAGRVIRAFGEFVVSGSFVVGAVVFLILTIVQFVVVAKGSERVAEVGARFVLDALPGKQLAIDAELRGGSIDPEEARRRRAFLERESQFYGAMDGAVRFVKGDVVASVLIAIVNLVGGVAIGVGQRGLELPQALQVYGLLTIGDGLVTQIPALLLAVASGILVTRVASEGPGRALGSTLSRELLAAPRALGVAGGLSLVLAAIPGLPALPFLVIGAGLVATFVVLERRAESVAPDEPEEDPLAPDGTAVFVPLVVPWSLEFGPKLASTVSRAEASPLALPERIRRRVFRDRGVPLPVCRCVVEETLPDHDAVLSIHEVPACVIEVPSGLPDEEAVRYVETRVTTLLVDRAADFLGISETKALLDELERKAPATVRAVVPKLIDLGLLTDVLRRLVEEHIGVRDLRAILEAVARAPATERDALPLAEHVRSELRRALTYDLTGGRTELDVTVLDADIEDTIRAAVSKTSAGTFLALAPAAARDIVTAIERAMGDPPARAPAVGEPPAGAPAVILTRPDIRRFVKKLIETDLPKVRVVSFQELLPEIVLQTRGRATLTNAVPTPAPAP